MKTNFAAVLYRGIDPVSGVVGGVQMLAGLGQMIFSGQKKAERGLNKQIEKSPKYTQNKAIGDYYNEALSRYNVSPTASAMYKRQVNNIGRGVATGIAGLQDKRAGQSGISSILRAQNDAMLNTEVAAEQQRNQRFGQLGDATGMQAREDDKAFQQNEIAPFELKTNLAFQKLQGANQRANAGMANIMGGLQTIGGGLTPNKPKY